MITNQTIEAGGQTTEVSYEYDTINRLIAETRTAGVSPATSIEYAYDLAGNRTQTVDATSPSRSLSFGYDEAGNTTNFNGNGNNGRVLKEF